VKVSKEAHGIVTREVLTKTCTYWMSSWRKDDKTRRRGKSQEDGC
jgi:hypothetical protein